MLVATESRQPRREEGEREGGTKEEEKNRKTVEDENQASLSRAYASRAFSNRNVVFLLSQVSHLRWKKGENRVKVQEKGEDFRAKIHAKSHIFRCRFACFWKIVSMFS